MNKICTCCGESKSLHLFHKDQRQKDGRTARCALCRTQAQVEFQNKQKIERPEHYKRWRKSNNYSSKYGISLSDVEQKIKQQGNCCPICKTSLAENPYAVDHSHMTGKVREILCHSCNKGIGFFYESTESLANAILYLQKHTDV